MPSKRFSYIFDEEIERVYNAFIFASENLRISFKDSLSDLIFHTGNCFDNENCKFSFKWKNYYKIKMIVEKIIKTKFHKSYTHTSINIDKVPLQIRLTFDFFWDSVNKKTIFFLIVNYEDDFFTDLINNDFTEDDKLTICKIFEEYLKKSLKGTETGYSYLLNTKLENLSNYILYPKLFFQLISKNRIQILNEQLIDVNNKYELLMTDEKTNKLVPFTTLTVEKLIISSYYAKITYNTHKILSLPNIKITFIFKQLANKKCIFFFNMKPKEPISHDINYKILKFWKKQLTELWLYFEKEKKINSNNTKLILK